MTRPGISAIAGALAVELAISLSQHPNGVEAPAFYQIGPQNDTNLDVLEDQCILGLLPHSIRGFLSSFSQVLPATHCYDKCVACSRIVREEFHKNGFDFLLKVFNSSRYLEDLTGLSELFSEENYIDASYCFNLTVIRLIFLM